MYISELGIMAAFMRVKKYEPVGKLIVSNSNRIEIHILVHR